ncbi:hypothetical protein DsansV1_C01g0008991 [Dioscorea sansibarensis]
MGRVVERSGVTTRDLSGQRQGRCVAEGLLSIHSIDSFFSCRGSVCILSLDHSIGHPLYFISVMYSGSTGIVTWETHCIFGALFIYIYISVGVSL